MDIIQQHRKEIDAIDDAILKLLAKRFEAVKQIGMLKKKRNLPVINKERENELMASLIEKAKTYNLTQRFIEKIWKTIFGESYIIENNL